MKPRFINFIAKPKATNNNPRIKDIQKTIVALLKNIPISNETGSPRTTEKSQDIFKIIIADTPKIIPIIMGALILFSMNRIIKAIRIREIIKKSQNFPFQ